MENYDGTVGSITVAVLRACLPKYATIQLVVSMTIPLLLTRLRWRSGRRRHWRRRRCRFPCKLLQLEMLLFITSSNYDRTMKRTKEGSLWFLEICLRWRSKELHTNALPVDQYHQLRCTLDAFLPLSTSTRRACTSIFSYPSF